MEQSKLMQILDKNIDQQGLLKDIAAEFMIPEIEKLKQKVLAKEIDLIKSTDVDNNAIASVLDAVIAKLKGE